MHIAVIGASGRTGAHIVEQGLRRGHRITAVVRRPASVLSRHELLSTAEADAYDRTAIDRALAGCQGVISALGVGTSRRPTDLYSTGTANVVAAMRARSIARLAVISAAPAGPRSVQPYLTRRVLMPLLDRAFGATYEDMRAMEAQLRASAVDWVALRPPRLIDKPAKGHYRVGVDQPPPAARSLTYADLATALLDAVEHCTHPRQAQYVAN